MVKYRLLSVFLEFSKLVSTSGITGYRSFLKVFLRYAEFYSLFCSALLLFTDLQLVVHSVYNIFSLEEYAILFLVHTSQTPCIM